MTPLLQLDPASIKERAVGGCERNFSFSSPEHPYLIGCRHGVVCIVFILLSPRTAKPPSAAFSPIVSSTKSGHVILTRPGNIPRTFSTVPSRRRRPRSRRESGPRRRRRPRNQRPLGVNPSRPGNHPGSLPPPRRLPRPSHPPPGRLPIPPPIPPLQWCAAKAHPSTPTQWRSSPTLKRR